MTSETFFPSAFRINIKKLLNFIPWKVIWCNRLIIPMKSCILRFLWNESAHFCVISKNYVFIPGKPPEPGTKWRPSGWLVNSRRLPPSYPLTLLFGYFKYTYMSETRWEFATGYSEVDSSGGDQNFVVVWISSTFPLFRQLRYGLATPATDREERLGERRRQA